MGNQAPLTAQEIRDVMPYMNTLGTGAVRRLEAEAALQNLEAIQKSVEAIQKFDESTGKTSRQSL
ncbi:MAG: hypothetical protein EXQ56_09740 [Acidobacteria bacterium]|nr:hypothetical protein [Acidobacteriota bacterium]